MATMPSSMRPEVAARPTLTPVPSPSTVCGECRHHMPQATSAGSWCALAGARLFGQPVTAEQAACADFATWPEGSDAPLFLSAMRF